MMRIGTFVIRALTVAGVAALVVTHPIARAGVERVQAFKRLTAPRIDPGPLVPGPLTVVPKGLPFDESPTFTKRHLETGGTRGAGIMCPANLNPWCKMLDDALSTRIPFRDREIVFLRTAWLTRGRFIWATHHDTRAFDAGLTAADLARLTKGPDAPGWSKWDATLVRMPRGKRSVSATATDSAWT